jgi:hypothetical protein
MMHSPLRDRKHLYGWMQQQVMDRGFESADGLYFTNVPQLRSKLGNDVHHHQEWLTDLAVDFIKHSSSSSSSSSTSNVNSNNNNNNNNIRRPFFLVMASTLPHGPDLPLWPKENETMRTISGDIIDPTEVLEIRKKRQAAHAKCSNIEFQNGFDKLVKHRHSSIRWLVQYIALKVLNSSSYYDPPSLSTFSLSCALPTLACTRIVKALSVSSLYIFDSNSSNQVLMFFFFFVFLNCFYFIFKRVTSVQRWYYLTKLWAVL